MKLEINGNTYVVGDIHGNTTGIQNIIAEYDLSNCNLILLGDIGIWQYKDYKHYINFDLFCNARNINSYVFRENHDNPIFFLRPAEQGTIVKRFWNKFTNFKLIPDLTRVSFNGYTGIVIGGGLSIDRCCRRSFQSPYRINGGPYKKNDWWPDEVLPSTKGIDEKIDFILSHTGPRPYKIGPLNKNNCSFFRLDATLQDAINEESKRIEEIQKQFKPAKWWFGHYHINDNFDYFETRCIAVDINFLSPLYI